MTKKTYYISEIEVFPVYWLTDEVDTSLSSRLYRYKIELTNDEYKDYERVLQEYDKWQEILAAKVPW